MDAKAVKAELKAAREAIRNKDYKESLAHCKNVLKHDKNNYNALVFVGVSAEGLEQPDQALAAYRRAVEAEPTQLLAWQGLCTFYEKSAKAEYFPDLAEVYRKLTELYQNDSMKKIEIMKKLSELLESLRKYDEAVTICEDLIQDSSLRGEDKVIVLKRLGRILDKLDSSSMEQNMKLEDVYKQLLESGADDSENEINSKLLNLLLKRNAPVEDIKSHCERVVTQCPTSVKALETLCTLYLDSYVTGSSTDIDNVDVVRKLKAVNEDHALVTIMAGLDSFKEHDYKQALQLLLTGLENDKSSTSGWVLLAEVQVKLHNSESAEKSAKKARQLYLSKTGQFLGDGDSLEYRIKLILAEALLQKRDEPSVIAALDILKKLEKHTTDARALCAQCTAYVLTEDYASASHVLDQLKKPTADTCHLQGWLYLAQGKMQDALTSLTSATSEFENSPLAWFWLGRVYWKEIHNQSNASPCLQAFLKAAKTDPFYGLTFLYLGHYYNEIVKDKQRACRCYKKAYELDTINEEIGTALVDTLVTLGDDAMANKCLSSVTKQSIPGSGKWAWLRLGVQQLKSEDPASAVLSLQAALRANPKDSHIWECLGEAYMSRGSYTAALKAFSKAIELNSDALYCYYQLAEIQRTLGMFTEAVMAYKDVLNKEADYVPALKGLGETHLNLGREALKHFFHGRCVDHCQAALLALTRAASVRPDLSCVWKLIGDACTIIYAVPDEIVKINIPVKLLKTENNTEACELMEKKDILGIGARCYGMALKQQPECSSLWHDLGVSYFYQSQLGGATAEQLASKAVQALQKALSLTASHHHWTALGVIAASKEINHPGLAQHCFIKSIEAESNNVTAWTNLGTLYLKHDDIKLAHEAFKAAQSLDPSYTACWIGQALIAEAVGDDDTMDLFRHTTELGAHVEGNIGYAHWVSQTLRDKKRLSQELFRYSIEKMAAIPAAADAMAKYTDKKRDNGQALNLYGLLLERLGLFRSATNVLAQAVKHLTGGPSEQLNAARANHARVLCQTENYEETIKEYNKLGKDKIMEDLAWEAYAYYKLTDYANSLAAYEEALNLARSEEEKSHLQAARGMVAYKAGDISVAKAAFFASSQMSPPSVAGLLALCSLGLLNSDATLVAAVLQEMDKLDDGQALADLTFLRAHCQALWSGLTEGRRHVAKVLHRYPDKACLWQQLGSYLLKNGVKCKMAATCARSAACLSSHVAKEAGVVTSLAALSAGLHRDPYNCFRLAQKAVHNQPDALQHWCTLLSCIYAECVIQKLTVGSPLLHVALSMSTNIMSRVEKELGECTGDKSRLHKLYLWSLQQYILLLLRLGRLDKAKKFIEQAVWVYEDDPILKSLAAFLDSNFKVLRQLATNHNVTFIWQLLCGALSIQGLMNEVVKTQSLCVESAESPACQLTALIHLAYSNYTRIMGGDDGLTTTCFFDEACDKALKLYPSHPVICLMQAVVSIHSNDIKQTKQKLYQGASDDSDTVVIEARELCQRLLDKIVQRKQRSPFDEDSAPIDQKKDQSEDYEELVKFVERSL